MYAHQLSIPQAPRIRLFKENGKHIARITLVEVVSAPCASEFEATAQAIAVRQALLQDPQEVVALLQDASETGG